MNVFTTDHPLTSDASPLFLRLQRRVVKGFFVVLASYPLYLLLLGPLWALDGHGVLDFAPEPSSGLLRAERSYLDDSTSAWKIC